MSKQPANQDAGEKAIEKLNQLSGLAEACAIACVCGRDTVPVTFDGCAPPAGFPLLSTAGHTDAGAVIYNCHPVEVMAWVHAAVKDLLAKFPASTPPNKTLQ